MGFFCATYGAYHCTNRLIEVNIPLDALSHHSKVAVSDDFPDDVLLQDDGGDLVAMVTVHCRI